MEFDDILKHDEKGFSIFHLIRSDQFIKIFEPIRKKAVETNKEDALKRLIEAMCVCPNGYTYSYIDNYKDREDFNVEEEWDTFSSAHDIAFFGESELVINSLLDVFINDIRGSHLDFNRKAVELYDWVHEPDTGSHENRREALELLLTNLVTKNTELSLYQRQLNTVPAILNEYTWLTTLSLGHNRLTELPDLSELSLQKVSLENNVFTGVPFGLPLSLTELNMCNNLITQTHSPLESLSENCQVDLSGNPISEDTIIRLNRILNAPNYHGPRILFSMQSEPVVHSLFPTKPTLPEVLAKWGISETVAAWINIRNEAYFPNFLSFIHKLGQTINFSNPNFRKNVTAFLTRLVSESKELRAHVFLIAEEADSSCEDRASLAYNQIKNVYLNHAIEQGEYDNRVKEIIQLARGMFRMNKLEQIAREKVKKLNFCDEIDVFLAYQVKLQKRLSLPVETPDMRFFSISWVTPEDLNSAEQEVRDAEKTEFDRFLATEYFSWLSFIKRQDPSSYKKMEKEKNDTFKNFDQALVDYLEAQNLPINDDTKRVFGAIRRKEIQDQLLIKLNEKFLADKKISLVDEPVSSHQ